MKLMSAFVTPPRMIPRTAAAVGRIAIVWITFSATALGQQPPYDGLAGFIVERDGQFLANVPEHGTNPFGRPIFQNLQYSDTPTQPLVPLRFTDTKAEPGTKHTYRVIAVNTVGLKSVPSGDPVAAGAR